VSCSMQFRGQRLARVRARLQQNQGHVPQYYHPRQHLCLQMRQRRRRPHPCRHPRGEGQERNGSGFATSESGGAICQPPLSLRHSRVNSNKRQGGAHSNADEQECCSSTARHSYGVRAPSERVRSPVAARNSAKGGKQRAISTYRRSQASRHGRRKAHGDPAGAGAATPPPPAVATRAHTASKQCARVPAVRRTLPTALPTGRRT